MNLHVLDTCSAFMEGLALVAREAGHAMMRSEGGVDGTLPSRRAVDGAQPAPTADTAAVAPQPDMYIVGPGIARGDPALEALLDAGAPFVSSAQWLAERVLAGRHVVVVAGAHGKTSTGAMLAWILEQAGMAPGFLLGGVLVDFGCSARRGRGPFIVAADARESAFMDARAAFLHYRPRTVVLNDLDVDRNAPDAAALELLFHRLVRTVPRGGRLVVQARDAAAQRVLALGCWSEIVHIGARKDEPGAFRARGAPHAFDVLRGGLRVGHVAWSLLGAHNQANALAAIAAAEHLGVAPEHAARALANFHGVHRRLELCGTVPLEGTAVQVYDDLAEHPTAMRAVIDGLRRRADSALASGKHARIMAVLDARCEGLKAQVLRARLPWALEDADLTFCHAGEPGWNARQVLSPLGASAVVCESVDKLVEQVVRAARAGDHVLCLGDCGHGLRARVLGALARRAGVSC